MAEKSARVPFRHNERRLAAGLVQVDVIGYLDATVAADYLGQLTHVVQEVKQRDGKPVGLLFCDQLTGFDPGRVARLHGEWFMQMGDQLLAIAILSKKPAVRFGVGAAKLIVRKPLEMFDEEQKAHDWLVERQRGR